MVLKLSIHFVFGSQLTCNRMRRRCKHFTMVDGFGGEMSYMKAVIHMFFNISILKNFLKLTGKQHCRILFFSKVAGCSLQV